MDVTFLKDISEAYIIDSGLDVEPNCIFEELYGVAKFLQEYDAELYNELYESTKLQQQQILKGYLDVEYNQEVISEQFSALIGLGIAAVIASITAKPLSVSTMKLISKLGGWFEKFGEFLSRRGSYSRLRYTIIHKNTEKCYRECGIKNAADIRFFTTFVGREIVPMPSARSVEQARCLRNCYIDSLIDIICLHIEDYFACLKRTGGDVLRNIDNDELLKTISTTNLSASCESYYDAAKEALDNFYKLLDYLYYPHEGTDADERADKIGELRKKLYNTKRTIERANDHQIKRYDIKLQKNNR